MKNISRIFVLIVTCGASIALTGCALQQTAPSTVQGTALQGLMYGGSQPISGAAISLYAASTNGYGQAYQYTEGLSLLGDNTVTTNGSGAFSITNEYTCPSASTLVYLVGTGGNPGLANGATNPQIALMAALGPCGSLSSSTKITMNEITTVATVWALSPFMSGIANIGTSSTNQTGLTNAFASVNKLVNVAAGAAPGLALPAGATAPVAKLNTLANILATCVNSAGGQAGLSNNNCGTLFRATTVNGIAAPTNTAIAAMNLAQHPTLQTTALTALSSSKSPFQPSLGTPPSDYTLAVTYTGNGILAPKAVAADASGNIWIANSGNNTVTELANTGAPLSGAGGYTIGSLNVPSAIAIDSGGNAWVTNAGNSSVTKVSSTGSSASVFTGGGLNAPAGVAIDQAGTVWIANSSSSNLTQINSAGTVSSVQGPGGTSSKAIAIDPN